MRKFAWALIKFLGLREWFAGDSEVPTDDDFRNPFWRLTEKMRFEPEWTLCLLDLRLWYFKSKLPLFSSNFYNGFLTFNIYLTKPKGRWFLWPRFNLAIRPCHPYWLAFGVGSLWDRGEFGWTGPWFYSFKGQSKNNPGVIAKDHEEGAI